MTTPPSTGQTPDLPSTHAAITPIGALISIRRALYQLAVELLDLSPPPGGLPADVLDNPVSRGRIGAALATGERIVAATLPSCSALVVDGCRLPVGRVELLVASRADAQELLSNALNAIGNELSKVDRGAGSLRLLTEADGDRFTDAFGFVREGVALARSISPALIDDLLPHIALLGIVDPRGVKSLGSASSRRFPGLVLVPAPRSAAEVAEAIVHEGAHQKLFDLAVTGAVLTEESDLCPPFEPSWPPTGRQWPMEQALAAGHAYACLAHFALDAEKVGALDVFDSGSLLRAAPERSNLIGRWLFDRAKWLDADAHTLLAGLCGRRPVTEGDREAPLVGQHTDYVLEGGWTLRRCQETDRVLVGRRFAVGPPELFFISDEAATVLEILSSPQSEEVVSIFACRHSLSRAESVRRVAVLSAQLADVGLVRLRPVE
jgi:hypothetical protein